MDSEPATTTLILGGSGFLGAHLVAAALWGRRWEERVVAAGRSAPPVAGGDEEDEPSFEPVDLLAAGALDALLRRLRPDRVLLAAGLSRVADCARYPDLARVLNRDVPASVARWCAARGTRLVHVSTDLVFGGLPPSGERYAEDDPPAPVHEYGASKAAGEEQVLRAHGQALVVRLPLLCGDSGGRALGASDALVAAVRRGERPALFTDEWRTPLDARLAAEAVIEALGSELSGLLHVAGPERMSRYELGLAVLAAHGIDDPAARVVATTRAGAGVALERPEDVSLDAGLARHHLRSIARLGPGAFLDHPGASR